MDHLWLHKYTVYPAVEHFTFWNICGNITIQRSSFQPEANCKLSPDVSSFYLKKKTLLIYGHQKCGIIEVGKIKQVLPADITPWSHVSCDARVSRKVLNPRFGVGHEGLSGFHKNRLLTTQSSWQGALPLTVISPAQIKNSCSQVFSPSLNTWYCHTNGRRLPMQLLPIWGAGTPGLQELDWTERDLELLTSASVCACVLHGAFMNRQRGQPLCHISAGIPAICDWIERPLELFQKAFEVRGCFYLTLFKPSGKNCCQQRRFSEQMQDMQLSSNISGTPQEAAASGPFRQVLQIMNIWSHILDQTSNVFCLTPGQDVITSPICWVLLINVRNFIVTHAHYYCLCLKESKSWTRWSWCSSQHTCSLEDSLGSSWTTLFQVWRAFSSTATLRPPLIMNVSFYRLL